MKSYTVPQIKRILGKLINDHPFMGVEKLDRLLADALSSKSVMNSIEETIAYYIDEKECTQKEKVMRLQRRIERALKKEQNDDHLTDEQRAKLVNEYRKVYKGERLPTDLTEAYLVVLGF